MNSRCRNCGAGGLSNLFEAPAFDTCAGRAPILYGVARCTQCGITTIAANEQDLESAYTPEYYGSTDSKFMGVIERTVTALAGRQASSLLSTWQRDWTQRNPPAVLDIGCGRGILLRAMKHNGASVLGLEREGFVKAGDALDEVRSGSIFDDEYTELTFDIIVLWHVLEHLEDQDRLLDHLAARLNAGGILVLAVPNFSSWQSRLFGKYWFHLDLPRHLVHIESRWLNNRLQARGLQVVNETHFDLLQNIYGFVQSALNSVFHRRQNALYRHLRGNEKLSPRRIFSILAWSIPAGLVLPFAVLDFVLSGLTGNGATVQLIARQGETDD